MEYSEKELLAKIESKPYKKYTLVDLYPVTKYQSMTERTEVTDKIQNKLDKMVENMDIFVECRYYSKHAKF
jgi:hypothetical protein